MERAIPRPGELYIHFKDKLYQIITVATHSETQEQLVIYQALYDDFKTYARPLEMFLSPVDREKYPDVKQKYRFEKYEIKKKEEDIKSSSKDKEIYRDEKNEIVTSESQSKNRIMEKDIKESVSNESNKESVEEAVESLEGQVHHVLLDFLDATSYSKKLEIISSNMKHITDRMINDMAVSLDCSIGDGPIENRVHELMICLKAMSRFEDRRMR